MTARVLLQFRSQRNCILGNIFENPQAKGNGNPRLPVCGFGDFWVIVIQNTTGPAEETRCTTAPNAAMTPNTRRSGPSRQLSGSHATALRGGRRFIGEFCAALGRHRWLLVAVLAYWGVGAAIARSVGLPAGATVSTYLPVYLELIPWALVAFVLGRCVTIVLVERPAHPLRLIGRDLRDNIFASRRILNALPMLGAILVFGGT
ncbi:MAG TPA: hypothetical protein VFV51_03905, partial [Vicinamibacterales bacterium]|nr:hypothetical protein [Vicinamibacterales bacterium]